MGVSRKTRKITTNDHDHMSLSVRRHGEKRVVKPVNQQTTTIGSLPRDLLVDVLARVASSSFTDLFNAKLSCKEFHESTPDDSISQCISIDNFPINDWLPPSKRARSFLTKCFEKGNPESLFRQGMVDYFKLVKVESGLEHLKRAVEKGHSEATYVYGLIHLSRGDDQSGQEGLDLLNSMKYSRSKCWNVRDCRNKVDSVLRQMWIDNPLTLEKVDTKCQERDHVIRFKGRGWSLDEDEEIASCDTCLWYRELIYFCKAMNVIV